jgi:hypothetical protein
MQQTSIRVALDEETLRHLRELAATERRATADQAAVILTKVMTRRARQPSGRPIEATER